ncbi:MAG: saccharopine dehydrogenase NADP-binding domain-containing protein, partial [Candidatus Poseidoniia archaeon]|nr:saccharopine dehydrogenase NADP-binding domain-containing protein [Candidatus Poseidoniia archaeon]
MARIAVLGGGLVGSLVTTELARKHSVSLLDPDQRALEQLARHAPAADLQAERFSSARQLAGRDLALNCLPGSAGHAALTRIIDAGVDCVDISFTERDP